MPENFALIFCVPFRFTLAVIVRRLAADLPEKFQSSFSSLAAYTPLN